MGLNRKSNKSPYQTSQICSAVIMTPFTAAVFSGRYNQIKTFLRLQFCLSPDYLRGGGMTCILVSLSFIVDSLCFFSTAHYFGSFWFATNISYPPVEKHLAARAIAVVEIEA